MDWKIKEIKAVIELKIDKFADLHQNTADLQIPKHKRKALEGLLSRVFLEKIKRVVLLFICSITEYFIDAFPVLSCKTRFLNE